MIVRALTLAGGLAGAAATSQLPEYSQQYVQRLGGAVDALHEVVADFDASAQAVGLTRDAALAQMTGTDFLARRQADMAATFARYDRLSEALEDMQGQGPFMRTYKLPQMPDGKIARAAWDTYQPAVPLNFAGVTFAGVGFLIGALFLEMLLRLLAWPFRRGPQRQSAP
jgi:hypothetical protein